MGDKQYRHVYIIADEEGTYKAHSYDKYDAKGYVKQYKGYQYKKIKNTEKVNQVLFDSELVIAHDGGLYLTESEENFFSEAFDQFKADVEYDLGTLNELISYLKLSDKEKHQFKLFNKIIFTIIRYNDDCDGYDNDELISLPKAMKYFIKNVLGGKV